MSEKKLLIKNFSALSIMQAGTMLMPIVTIPYIVRVLGIDNFGLVSFAQAIMLFLVVVGDFGINLYAPKIIASVRHDSEVLKDAFWSLSFIRIVAILIMFAIIAAIILMVPQAHDEICLFIGSSFYALSILVFPVWFLQGMEQLILLAFFNFIVRLVGVILIFIFIKHASDYWLVPYLQGGVPTVIFLGCFVYILKRFSLGKPRFSLNKIRKMAKEVAAIFVTNISVSTYTTLNPVVLGFVAGNAAVGYFAGAQKLVAAVLALFHGQMSQIFYPNISRKYVTSEKDALHILRYSFAAMMITSISIAIVGFVYAPQALRLVLGIGMEPAVLPMRLMLIGMVFIAASNVFGIQTMLPFGLKRQFSTILTISALVNLSMTFFLSRAYAQDGAAAAWLITESIIAIAMYAVLRRKSISYVSNVFRFKLAVYAICLTAATLLSSVLPFPQLVQIPLAITFGVLLLQTMKLVNIGKMTVYV